MDNENINLGDEVTIVLRNEEGEIKKELTINEEQNEEEK